ncbi:peroxisome assembly protein 12 isoform X1 [Gadus morhua]|uniref:peroxisome assembly protein 12 isoform X1 n=1 Tax=Gadus morhua TaxID=8049 RepID=UPI0011B59AC4|nr:peroxisome assembly protein 12 isoform X1 [Gadus morhua]
MAESGAHLTVGGGDAERPSIFQLLAQESLMEAVRPALQHAAKVLAEAHPSALGFLWRSYEELYLLLDLLLQSHLLSSRSASFSENFYGLKRVPRAGGGALGRGARGRSLLLLCLLPYLLRRLRRAVSRRRDQDDFSIPPAPRLHRLHRLLACGGGAWAVLRLAQTLLYVAGRARTHSPLLWLAGVRLTPLTARDLSLMRRERPGGPTGSSRLVQAVVGVAGGVAGGVATALSLGTFFLQFLEWWYSSDHQDSIKSLTSLPAPPPPLHLLQPRPSPSSSPSSPSSSCCPLCGRLLSNHTVLSTSGYVFCYRCIYAFVKGSQRCPLSGYPTQLQHLVKIYTS